MKTETNNKHAIAELSVDTQVIEKRLAQLNPGETVSYGELSKLIDRDVQGPARHVLESARRRLLKDKQMVFDAVWNEGIKRLEDSDIALLGRRALKHIGRTAKLCVRRQACADYESLPVDTRRTMDASNSMLGAIHAVTKPSMTKKIEDKVAQTQARLPIGTTLEAFKS